ncbi:MAG: hypothetical protein ABIT01_11845 [Thermoanaerobaculia bacterium]
MTAIRRCLLVLALLLLGLAELRRHAAERSLYRAVGLAQLLSSHATGFSPGVVVDRVDALTKDAARGLPGDPRPAMARGEAHLAAGHAAEAQQAYLEALVLVERTDALVGLGRAELLAGRAAPARAAFMRAAWISPSVLPAIPDAERSFVQAEVLRQERLLLAGRLVSVTALPYGP